MMSKQYFSARDLAQQQTELAQSMGDYDSRPDETTAMFYFRRRAAMQADILIWQEQCRAFRALRDAPLPIAHG